AGPSTGCGNCVRRVSCRREGRRRPRREIDRTTRQRQVRGARGSVAGTGGSRCAGAGGPPQGGPGRRPRNPAAVGRNPRGTGKVEARLQNQKLLAVTRKLLAPTRVRLTYRDAPVLEAVADLAAKTGFQISYIDDPEKLNGRKVTLDTGDTTFWQAFDLFCRKA